MGNTRETYDRLIRTVREISLLGSVGAVLHWDDRTQMPPKGAGLRADQLSLLARMTHEQFTSATIGEWLGEIETSELVADPQGDVAANVRELRRTYNRATKLPASLVEEMSKTEILAQQAWADARKKSEFVLFQPWLAKTIELKQQEAACIGYKTTPYDPLLDQFEPGDTTVDIKKVFESLRAPLAELVANIGQSPRKAPAEILERHYPAAAQAQMAREAAAEVGFDFEGGRLDVSLHPFCSTLGPGDTRLTTRYDPQYFGDAFFGVLHETGHGLYGQGLPAEHFGTPLGEAISLGIHESQSRMWENLVGRSRAFWKYYFPKAKAAFPQALADVSPEQWYFAINDVRPSLIRTESDETTYNLHILLRFEIEQAMMSGQVKAADVPTIWNEMMRKNLGLTPPDDARGCLQDIHWSSGAIGYFPTYTLGNLYAAQLFEQARIDLGDLDGNFERGEFRPLLTWLREKIHRHGQRYTARQLIKRITGKELSAEPLLRHLREKASDLYGV